MNYLPPLSPSAHLVSDTSGAWGCGAYWGSLWFQLEWPEEWQEENIATKELVPIVVGVALWGASWQGLAVSCHCDNMAVVSAINSGRARYPPLNRLLCCLFFFTAHFKIAISAQHIQAQLMLLWMPSHVIKLSRSTRRASPLFRPPFQQNSKA